MAYRIIISPFLFIHILISSHTHTQNVIKREKDRERENGRQKEKNREFCYKVERVDLLQPFLVELWGGGGRNRGIPFREDWVGASVL